MKMLEANSMTTGQTAAGENSMGNSGLWKERFIRQQGIMPAALT
ncbi:hypothetical protein [Rhizobium leguminosarum]|nr:hypothetical protein [Rhizobium leguminosarum]